MKLGMVGLGRMGGNMAQRLARRGHFITGFDPDAHARSEFAKKGLIAADSIEALLHDLRPPRIVWLMIPSGAPIDDMIARLLPLLSPQDVLVDGGNSYYKDSQRRARELAPERIDYIDVGTSGGIWGMEEGYSLMVGGPAAVVSRLTPIFEALAPAPDLGWGHVGPSGAGHFVKMVHNGIEYGLMQAYAEGFALMQRKEEFKLDLHQIAEVWRQGSVVRSWLLDLTAATLRGNPALDGIAPFVADSGEGRWTVAEAIDLDVAAPVITLSLIARLRSRDPASFSDKLLASLRNAFGGHAVRRK
ncbi:MAG: gndA [Betaproteobacteria bacterium]|nr:gndA [Betaproteobacteria bacterium]